MFPYFFPQFHVETGNFHLENLLFHQEWPQFHLDNATLHMAQGEFHLERNHFHMALRHFHLEYDIFQIGKEGPPNGPPFFKMTSMDFMMNHPSLLEANYRLSRTPYSRQVS